MPTIDDYLSPPLPHHGIAHLNGAVRPLHFPSVHDLPLQADDLDAAEARAETISALARAEAADHAYAHAIESAWKNGHEQGRYEGEKHGFTQGTHWGMFVGACGTLVVVAIAAIGGAFAIGAGYIALG